MLKGIDVSHWNSEDDIKLWSTRNNLDFMIIKATEGKTLIDTHLDKNLSLAESLGVKCIGFYHYAHPENNMPEVEAEFFVKTIENRGYIGKALLAVDIEAKAFSVAQIQTWVLKFCHCVYNMTGVKPLVYLSSNEVVGRDWSTVVDGDYGLWLAHWNANKPKYTQWSTLAIWQQTVDYSTGTVGGIDVDIFYGDVEQWRKYCESKTGKGCPCECQCVCNYKVGD